MEVLVAFGKTRCVGVGVDASWSALKEELYKLEDLIEDSLGEDGDGGEDGGQLVAKLVALSERTPGDAAFARQLRRKFA